MLEIKLTKVCKKCCEEKELSEYYTQNKINANGESYVYFNPKCKQCTIEDSWNWQINNRERRSNNQNNYAKSGKGKEIADKARKNFRDNGKQTKWQRNNPDKVREYSDRRDHKKHEITTIEWESCKNYFNYRCCFCGLAIEEHYIKYAGKWKLGDFHRDHADDFGSNDLSNCIPSCKHCNTSKGDNDLESWYNENNVNFTQERLDKINNWLNEDYKKYKE